MKRIDDNTIEITQLELIQIRDFIERSLERAWDRYTDIYILSSTLEDGMRKMNPEMYEMAKQMGDL